MSPSYNIGSCACCAPAPSFLSGGQIWFKIDMAYTPVFSESGHYHLGYRITPTYELLSACPIPPGRDYPDYRSWLAVGTQTLYGGGEGEYDDPDLWVALFRSFSGLTWRINNPPSGALYDSLSYTNFQSMTATGDFPFTYGGTNYVLRFDDSSFDRLRRIDGGEWSDEDDYTTRVVWYCSYQPEPGAFTIVKGTSE